MICQQDVHVLSMDGPYDEWNFAAAEEWAETRELSSAVRRAISRARQWLLGRQQADARWTGHTAGDASLESRYILLSVFLDGEPSQAARRAAKYVISAQRPAGGWSAYPGGDVDPSVSTLAYFALKLTGHDPSCDEMRRARIAILSAGGADAIGEEARYWLALLGQIPYDACADWSQCAPVSRRHVSPGAAAGVPEHANFGRPIFGHGAQADEWSEQIAPLSIISLRRPVRQIDPRRGVRELLIRHPAQWARHTRPSLAPEKRWLGVFCANRVFQQVADRLLRRIGHRNEAHSELASRERVVDAARERLLAAIEPDDREPIEFTTLAWQRIALSALGYSTDCTITRRCQNCLDELVSDDGNQVRVQPCQTPLTDTALALDALHYSGLRPAESPMADAADWLLNEDFEATGVCNTARALLATAEPLASSSLRALPPSLRLLRTATDGASGDSPRYITNGRAFDGCEQHGASTAFTDRTDYGPRVESTWCQAASWLLAAQNEDGGWSVTAQERKHSIRRQANSGQGVFADATSTAYVSALVLQSLGRVGLRVGDPHIDRAIAHLNDSQQADGSWHGPHGANCVQGTAQAILGMRAVGVPANEESLAAGFNWLLAHQQPTGGWGDSAAGPTHAQLRGEGPETIAQTAWAVWAHTDAGLADHTATLRGVRYLHERQLPDGAWEETEFTSVDDPHPRYLRNDLHVVCTALSALSRWATAEVDDSTRRGESIDKK